MTMTDDTLPPAAPEVPVGPAVEEPTSGSLSRLWGIFVSPSKTFEHNARRPNWVAPLIGWMVVGTLMTAALVGMVDQVELMKNQLRNNPGARQMTEEQIEETADAMANSTFLRTLRYIGPAVAPFLMSFSVAALLWVLLLVIGTDFRYMSVVSVIAHSFFAYSVISGALLVAIFFFAEDPSTINLQSAVSSNLGFLVESKESPVLNRFLSSLDLLVLYFIFLVGLGLSKMSRKVSVAVGMVSVALLYSVYVGLVLVFTALVG